ncbi:MAG: SulP family inorganic anion transporter [Gemmataceae bacterium]|nr:SulP family inorganic anion transporter [Gemmataceae bacterium]
MNDSATSEVSPGSWSATFFRLVPAADSLRTYSLTSLRSDVLAGLTVAAVAVPQAMAYALIAGIKPEYGLYTAIVMTAVGALFDSSRQLINGPTNAISIAVFSALAPVVGEEAKIQAAVMLALMVGLVQTGITLFRLGDLTRYISHAVIVGFTSGAGLLLVLDQMKNLLGLPARGAATDHFLMRTGLTLAHIDEFHVTTAVVGIGTIALVLVLRIAKARLGLKLLPDLLLAVVIMAGLTAVFQLDRQNVQVVGEIPAQLPSLQIPTIDTKELRHLASSALAIAVLGLLEAIAMAKAIAAQTGQKLDMNQQCLSEGLANLAGSFFQCFPGSGSLTRSAINQAAGAVTQWSGVFSAVAVAAIMLLFAPLARYIPRAALAGILMLSAWRMVDRRQLMYYLRATRFDAGVVIATALSAVLISVEFCILIGTMLSFVLYVPRAARLHLTELTVTPERVIRERVPGDPPCGRILILNLEGELFFGSGPELEKHLDDVEHRSQEGVRIVVLRLKRARNPDAVCLEIIDGFVQRMLARKMTMLLCGVRGDLARLLHTSGIEARLGTEHVFHEEEGVASSTLDAVRYAYDMLGTDFCSTCPRRGQGEENKEPLYYMI